MTLEPWNNFLQAAFVVAAGATVVFGFGALMTERLINRRQAAILTTLERDLADAHARQADAETRLRAAVAAANERAGTLELEVEQQRERAATAERTLLELEQRLANRRLTPEQRARMVEVLEEIPQGHLSVSWVADNESARFKDDIVSVLRAAGWTVTPVGGVLEPQPPLGLIIETDSRQNQTALMLRRAFRAIGFATTGELVSGAPVGHVSLMVGSKP